MLKKFVDFFKDTVKPNSKEYYSNTGIREYTQEELDSKLFQSIETGDYNTFTDVINRGADINKVIDLGEGRTRSPLANCLYGWRNSDILQYKFIKVLFENKVELFNLTALGPSGPFEIDVYDTINKLISNGYRQKIFDSLLKNYPNYMSDRELRNSATKYNI